MAMAIHKIDSTNSSSSVSSQDDTDLINKYFADIEAEFEEAEQLIYLMQQDQDAIDKDSPQMVKELQDKINEFKKEFDVPFDHNIDEYANVDDYINAFVDAMHYSDQDFAYDSASVRENILFQFLDQTFGWDVSIKDLRKGCNPYLSNIGALNADIAKKEARLIEIDPGFKDLINSLEVLRSGSLRENNAADMDTKKDTPIIQKAFTALFEAMRDKCQTDKLEAMINASINMPDVSDADLEQLAGESLQSQSAENTVLQTLSNTLETAKDTFQTQKDAAELDKDKHTWINDATDAFDGSSGSAIRAKDRAIIDNANKMIKLLGAVDDSLSAEMGSISSPGFYQIGIILETLLKQVNEIFASDLSPTAKKEKILLAMNAAVGAINMLKAEVAKEKDALEKLIAEGAEKGSLANIRDIAAQTKQMAALKTAAKQLQKFMKVIKISVMVIGFLFAWFTGPLSLMLTGALTGLEAKGEIDKGVKALAKKLHDAGCGNSQLVAEMIVGFYEIGFMAAAGAADGEIAATVNAGSAAAKEAALIAIQETAEEIETTMNTVSKETLERITTEAQQKAEAAMKLVSQKLGRMSMRQSLPTLIKTQLQRTYQQNAAKAFESVVEQVQAEMKLMAETGNRVASQSEEQIANNAIADARNTTSRTIQEASAKDTAASIAKRTAWQSLYVMGARNVVVDSVIAAMKAAKVKESGDTFQALEILASVLQAVMAAFGGYKSMGSQLAAESMPIWFSRMMTAASATEIGTQAVLQGSLADNSKKQAEAVQAMTKSEAANQGFQFLLTRLFKLQKLELDAYIEEENKTSQTNYRMASKLESMENETKLLQVLQVTV